MSVNLKSLIAKLNPAARGAVESAAGLCVSSTHYDVEIEHFLAKLLDRTDNDFAYVLKHFGVDRARRRTNLAMVLRRCSLELVRRRPIGQLSKGYRQRVGLAAALVHEPPLLILDEPTAGLDPTQIREVRSLVRDLAGRHTILLSTHILSEVELTCDEIIMMSGGRVQKQSSITDLRRDASRGCQYIVETDAAEVGRAIAGLPSIECVETTSLGDAWYRLTITPVADAGDRREVISRTLKQKGAAVRELKRAAPTLEQLFWQRTEGPGKPSSAGAAGNGGVRP